jgi:alcohol dehydrogenase class IV
MNQSTFQINTRLVFGEGSLQRTGELNRDLGVLRPLIISDAGMAATGMVNILEQSLDKAGIESCLFTDVESDPGKQTVMRAAEAYLMHNCDGMIAFGGGSPMD